MECIRGLKIRLDNITVQSDHDLLEKLNICDHPHINDSRSKALIISELNKRYPTINPDIKPC